MPVAGVRLLLMAVLAAACSSGGPGWTYAPLGPSGLPASPGASAGHSPGPGLNLEVHTPPDQPLAFVPNVLNAPPATVVTANYLNNSNLEHNINFFAGPDQNAPSLGRTPNSIGPNVLDSVTFTTPDQPGSYFFWCDVHFQAMSGTLNVDPSVPGPSPSGAPSSPSGSPAASPAPATP